MIGGNFKENPDGSLRITRAYGKVSEMKAFLRRNQDDAAFLAQFYESELCNGYSLVNPADVGALTDAVMLSDCIIDDDTPEIDGGKLWWHSNYQLQGLGDTIVKQGYINLPKAN